MVAKCPSENTQAIEQDNFWSDVENGNLDAHEIGWIICGAAAALTVLISLITIVGHGRNYHRPKEQRQIIRVLLFAPIFAVISFLSYRYFRSYTYYELLEVIWEAIAIAAFLMLILQYIGDDEVQQSRLFAQKDKKKLPLPFCCFRYRPSKAYFLVLIKFSVVQYCFVRPALSIAGIITQYYGYLCEQSDSPKYAYIYLTAIDFVSISVALYGLFVLYLLVKEDLKGRRPLAKFMTLKLAVFATFYQSFVFDMLASHGTLKATQYWSSTNIADGLNALCTSLEMVLVAIFQMWAFPWSEYYPSRMRGQMGTSGAAAGAGIDYDGDATLQGGDSTNYGYGSYVNDAATGEKMHSQKVPRKERTHTNPIYAFFHALWLGDFMVELWHSIRFAIDRMRGKEYTRQDARFNAVDFVAAFGGDGSHSGGAGRANASRQNTGTAAAATGAAATTTATTNTNTTSSGSSPHYHGTSPNANNPYPLQDMSSNHNANAQAGNTYPSAPQRSWQQEQNYPASSMYAQDGGSAGAYYSSYPSQPQSEQQSSQNYDESRTTSTGMYGYPSAASQSRAQGESTGTSRDTANTALGTGSGGTSTFKDGRRTSTPMSWEPQAM